MVTKTVRQLRRSRQTDDLIAVMGGCFRVVVFHLIFKMTSGLLFYAF